MSEDNLDASGSQRVPDWNADDWVGVPLPERVRDLHPMLEDIASLHLGSRDLEFMRTGEDRPKVVGWIRGRGGCDTVEDLLDLTGEQILAWPQVGVGKRNRILEWIGELESHVPDILAVQDEVVPRPVDPDVALLARWGAFVSSATTWGEAEAAARLDAVPDDVAAALDRLRAKALPVLPEENDADRILEDWVQGLDDRERAILRGRLVRAPARTLDDIGTEHGVTRERIRQLERRLEQKIPTLLAQETWRPVRWEVFAVRHRFGAYAPLTPDEVEHLSSAEGFARSLVVWLAGYERLEDRVRARDFRLPSVGDLPTLPDLPILDEELIRERFIADGVAPELVDWTLDSVKGVGRVDGRPVLWPGNIVDKSYAVLAVRNRQMTPEELAAAIGGGVSVRGLRHRLYEDPRLCRVTRHHVGLAAWGGEAYTSVVDLMCARLEDGPRPVAQLAQELADEFGVSTASVSMYAAAPVFLVESGVLSLRPDDRPYVPRATPHLVPGLYRVGADAMVWNIEADHDLLRGSGRALPTEVATFLGMEPGVRITLRNEVRDVPINWLVTSHVGPNIGSLKAQVEAVDAGPGDMVRIVFDRSAHALEVSVRPPAADEGDPAEAAIARLTGLPSELCRTQELLASAVQVDVQDLDATLRRRGDDAVADLIPALAQAG